MSRGLPNRPRLNGNKVRYFLLVQSPYCDLHVDFGPQGFTETLPEIDGGEVSSCGLRSSSLIVMLAQTAVGIAEP